MKHTKIIATFGPAISDRGRLQAVCHAGVNMFRVNCSHGNRDSFLAARNLIREATSELEYPIGLLFDISGPKLRVGSFEGSIEVEADDRIVLTAGDFDVAQRVLSVNHPGIISSLKVGEKVYIDDGNLRFDVTEQDERRVVLTALNGGTLLPNKGINLPQTDLQIPTIGDKDREDIATAVEAGADFVAISFVRSGDDVLEAKRLINRAGGQQKVIAKLERLEAVQRLEEILLVADGVMVARGDLGVELPFEDVPRFQKEIIRQANRNRKPVIVATQMLESMRFSPRATRAEVNDVATAVYDYVDAVMLSAETATGQYPLEAVATMAQVINATEAVAERPEVRPDRILIESAPANAIAEAVSRMGADLEAAAIMAFTTSGYTAQLMANLYPRQPIIALTPTAEIMGQLTLHRGVYPVHTKHVETFDELIGTVEAVNDSHHLARSGDLVMVTGGAPFGRQGTTNFLLVHEMGSSRV
jgi:pyruvate kinase